MKKVLISMAAGAMALGGALPVAAGGNNNITETDGASIWEIVNDDSDSTYLADLILIAGMATMLDTCGNGKPFYTLFAPEDTGWDEWLGEEVDLLDALGATISELQASPSVVRGVINDHLVNGSFSPWQLDLDEITVLTARSGFTLRNENGETINDIEIDETFQACNGWVYTIDGLIDSTPQVPTEGLNAQDTPQDGTPGGSNSLPDTL